MDYVHKGIFNLKFIDTNHQWDDIFTKPITEYRFVFILKILKNGNLFRLKVKSQYV